MQINANAFFVRPFRTDPMTMSRSVFKQLLNHAADYCLFDDYNWDWSIVHTVSLKDLPRTLLLPSRKQAKLIGADGGMHSAGMDKVARLAALSSGKFEQRFEGKSFYGSVGGKSPKGGKGLGGWGRPMDQKHCMEVSLHMS
jgi:hypothetical protein